MQNFVISAKLLNHCVFAEKNSHLLLVLVPLLVLGGEVRPAPSLSAAAATSGPLLITPLAVVRQGPRVVQF
jgi:hypothetical protein